MAKVILKDWYDKDWLDSLDPKKNVVVFGDNMARIGKGGQAFVCRDHPVCHGIATKSSTLDYMSDDDLSHWTALIIDAFGLSKYINLEDFTIYLPKDGIGTGLANLPVVAPKLYHLLRLVLNDVIKSGENYDATTSELY